MDREMREPPVACSVPLSDGLGWVVVRTRRRATVVRHHSARALIHEGLAVSATL